MAAVDDEIDRPAAITAADAARGWRERAHRPEMRCAAAWSEACRAWWLDPADDRLRRRVADVLLASPDELAAWKTLGLDEASLVRAHGHVIAMRAGLERGAKKRTLVTGALRTGPVFSQHRTGRLVSFIHARELPAQVAQVAASFEALPHHPFMRAAWTMEVLGAIHPFLDGNGGTARFLSSLELARAWLPPLALTAAQRSGAYIEAVVTHDLAALELVLYDTVQQELASLLVGEGGAAAAWDATARERAGRWEGLVDAAWRRAASASVERDDAGASGAARLARRGYRLPLRPAAHRASWRLTGPLPAQLDLAIAPVVGGGRRWQIAVLGASVGEGGELAAYLRRDETAAVFVAVADEDDADVDLRFGRWLDGRIAQCLRGFATWM
jgi:hypothetical protein